MNLGELQHDYDKEEFSDTVGDAVAISDHGEAQGVVADLLTSISTISWKKSNLNNLMLILGQQFV